MPKSEKMRTDQNKGRKKSFVMDDEAIKFLYTITAPKIIDHNAPLSEFIRNHVLNEVREKIENAIRTNTY